MTRLLPFIISLIWTTGTAASAELATITLPAVSVIAAADEQTHATRGTVKSAAADAIVVMRPKHRGDITIEVAPATHVDGVIRVGVTVSVRYHDQHGRHVASAIAVEPPHPPAPVKPAAA